jgi:cell division protein FtsQ
MRKRTGTRDDRDPPAGTADAGTGAGVDEHDGDETWLRQAPAEARSRSRGVVAPRPRPRVTRPAARPAATPAGRSSAPRFAPRSGVVARRGREGAVAARGRRRRPRPAIALLGLVVVLLATGLGAYGVVSAGFFRVQQIEVTGAAMVDQDEVARATGALHRNLFTLDEIAARRAVERVSGVKRAEVRRVWPRRLLVTIEERVPVAVWSAGGSSYMVDSEGVVLDFIPDSSMLTIYQTDGGGEALAGDRVDGDAVMVAARLRDALPATIGQQVTRFEWTRRAGLELITDRGVRVRFGDGSDIDYKLAVWRGVLDQARRDKAVVTEIDLRFGDRVFYR